MNFDLAAFRAEFAFFNQQPDWVYLDNAATMHKPAAVIAAETEFYQTFNANVHRGAHQLSQQATQLFEQARDTVAVYLNASGREEIIWCSGATSALNQLAFGLMGTVLHPGDRILISALEHHANIVPWQFHCQQHGVLLDVIPLDANQQLDQAEYQRLLALKPKVVSMAQVSNVLGHIQPVAAMVQQAKAVGAITIIDGAQGILLQQPDVQQLDCDFYVFSGHKIYGPTGIGVLFGKCSTLELLRPLLYGGEMIQQVSFSGTTLNQLPYRLEAGTPNIASAIGLAAALRWLQQWDQGAIAAHKQQLLQQLFDGLQQFSGIELISQVQNNAGIIAFNIKGEHHSDVAALLDQQQIAVRAGTHCAMPLFTAIGKAGAVRISLAGYNSPQEIDRTLVAVSQVLEILS
ncbi:cysteine desulfurase [Rheinheimera riviphila]|uniref:cysteine desulfurase n=1 Tax=Rheinheimera riviphila TaxID=1834037 RepID=A0A437R347_9GAMM|nr:cysteine desulfurase [Rheinheimera riviphila]RVU41097.1 cysteine desulfurase [Rheinheimera riviphila]